MLEQKQEEAEKPEYLLRSLIFVCLLVLML